MAALATTNLTLLDLAKLKDPDGTIASVVELLNEKNELLEDAVFMQGNLETGHRTTVRTGIPTPTWRKLYGRVADQTARTAQVTENCGMLEAYAETDKALLDLAGNVNQARLNEEMAFIEGFKQKLAYSMIYESESNTPEAITGLAPRYNALTGAGNSENVLNAGGSTNLTSIWCVGWGDLTCAGIVPKNSTAGLQITDKGQVTSETASGKMEVYRTHFRQDAGLCVRDWRSVVRIANIDTVALAGLSGTQSISASTSILRLMIEAREKIDDAPFARPAFYVNRATRIRLRQAILDKVAGNLTFETVAGKRVMVYDDTPIRRLDQISSSETAVS